VKRLLLLSIFAALAIPAHANLTESEWRQFNAWAESYGFKFIRQVDAKLLEPQTEKKEEVRESRQNGRTFAAGLVGSPPAPSPWNGVPGAHHTENAIRDAINDPESYQLIGSYGVWPSKYEGSLCWLVKVAFRQRNSMCGYVKSIAFVYETGGDVPEVLGVEIE